MMKHTLSLRNFHLAMMNHINGSLFNLKMMIQKLYLSKTKLTDENCIDYWWCGFIAHHLIARILTQTDWNIVTLDRLDYSGNLNRLNDILQYECTPNERKRVKGSLA